MLQSCHLGTLSPTAGTPLTHPHLRLRPMNKGHMDSTTHTHKHTLEVEVLRDLPGKLLPAKVSVARRLLVDWSL